MENRDDQRNKIIGTLITVKLHMTVRRVFVVIANIQTREQFSIAVLEKTVTMICSIKTQG